MLFRSGEDNSVTAVLTPSVKKRFIRIITEFLVIGINHSFTRYVYSSALSTYHFHIVHFLSLPLDPFVPPEGCFKISGIRGEAQGAMRQIHSAAVTAGPDLTFAPASNFAAESPAALPGHRKNYTKDLTLLYYKSAALISLKRGKQKV